MTPFNDNDVAELLKRVVRLEDAVFGHRQLEVNTRSKKYGGVKGGVLLLIEQGFLDEKHSAAEVSSELEGHGYHYRRDVIQTALNRLSSVNKPLTAFVKDGKKVYAKRK